MSQIHAKTDKLSLVAVPDKDGKMRVTSQSWDTAAQPQGAGGYPAARDAAGRGVREDPHRAAGRLR